MVKLFITSDWHLGKTIYDYSLLPFQKFILEQLIQEAIDMQVNWFIIAGDIYDKRRPNKEEMKAVEDLLLQIYHAGINLLLVRGNHDGEVLTLYQSLLQKHNEKIQVHLIDIDEKKTNAYPTYIGEVEGFSLYALPYIDKATCLSLLKSSEISITEEQSDSLLDILLNHWIEKLEYPQKTILITHILPASLTSNEAGVDEIVGQMIPVNLTTLSKIGYVFSGHIHREMRPTANVFFPGAPYCLSPRDRYQPSSLLVTLENDTILQIESYKKIMPLFQIISLNNSNQTESIRKNISKSNHCLYVFQITSPHEYETYQTLFEYLHDEGIPFLIDLALSDDQSIPIQSFTLENQANTLRAYDPLQLIQTYVKEVQQEELSEEDQKYIQKLFYQATQNEIT